MKTYVFNLNQSLKDKVFSPIRSKQQLVVLLLNAIKTIRINQYISDQDAVGQIVLSISKMSRITFKIENKIFSIAFPFKVSESDGQVSIYSESLGEVDSVVISEVIEIFTDESIQNSSCVSEFATHVLEKAELKPGFWPFVKELIYMEDGYLRYDLDVDRENGHLHPEHHLDIFYSSKATFKLGLNEQLNDEELINILNTTTDCRYVTRAT
jgi:hypothetical protein